MVRKKLNECCLIEKIGWTGQNKNLADVYEICSPSGVFQSGYATLLSCGYILYRLSETIRENILFGRKDTSEEQMIEVAKKLNCHDFIMNAAARVRHGCS